MTTALPTGKVDIFARKIILPIIVYNQIRRVTHTSSPTTDVAELALFSLLLDTIATSLQRHRCFQIFIQIAQFYNVISSKK